MSTILHYWYCDMQMDCTQISRLLGCDPKTVWKLLKVQRIKTRPRGANWRDNLVLDGSAFRGKKHTPENREKQRQRRLQDGHVPYLKNGIHWLHATGRRPSSWRGGLTPERQAFYSTPEWKECVKAVWKRDDATCQRCKLDHRKIERGNPRFTIHHIDSFMIRERRADIDNLILLCEPCHKWIHSSKNTEGVLLGAGHKSAA